MTTRLQEAFARAQDLPEQVQDEIADAMMDEMDRKFDELIEAHPEVLERLVAEAREDIRAGRVAPLTEADFALDED